MLLDLPVEILSEVLVLLDYLDILRCSAVNHFLSSFPFYLSYICLKNRFPSNFMASSLRPSISNTASSSQRKG